MIDNRQKENNRIAIGADHAGYALKEEIIKELTSEGYDLQDFGTFAGEPVDYPDVGCEVANAIAEGEFEKGILICGTGIGITIAANKVKGIRAAVCSEAYSAKMARAHNNANIIGFGARVVGLGLALDIVKTFLETEFEAGSRHEMRVNKINAIDS